MRDPIGSVRKRGAQMRTSRTIPAADADTLLKQTVAARLRDEIVQGALEPGERVVEGTWARRLKVAQGSIREAINLLAQEGFVTKAAGRSARVVQLSEADVVNLYAVRGALEGLAARTAAARSPDVSGLQAALDGMRTAAAEGRGEQMLEHDLAFHTELCRLSGNGLLVEHARRLLLPFFAFVRIRVIAGGRGIGAWSRDLESHQRIVDLLREGEGEVLEMYVRRAMERYATTARSAWERDAADEERREENNVSNVRD